MNFEKNIKEFEERIKHIEDNYLKLIEDIKRISESIDKIIKQPNKRNLCVQFLKELGEPVADNH